jgi:Flp pilus assembly pilin Flp
MLTRSGTWRRGAAALEFAVIAPVAVAMLMSVYDISRALIAWQQTCSAAEGVVQAAFKLSVVTDPTVTALSSTQMQSAMSTIYAAMPGLNLGNGTGSFPGAYSVTLSSIVFVPLCAASSGCATQTPYTLWSTSLSEGGTKLLTSVARSCGALTSVASLSNSSTRLTQMLNPILVSGGTSMTLVPQLVADVQYTYTPLFSLFVGTVTFWATAALPAPINGTVQEVTYNTTAPAGSVTTCTLPSS